MNHPQDRSERRFIRELNIAKRKKSYIERYYYRRGTEIPHEGDEPGLFQGKIAQYDGPYIRYLSYLKWMEMSENERKIAEVEAKLDGKDIKDKYFRWQPTKWSRFAKNHSLCSCHSCRAHSWGEKTEKRKRRVLLDKRLKESLED